MKASAVLLVLGILVSAVLPAAEVPDYYNHVESVDWVVSDLDSVVKAWRELGFAVAEHGVTTLRETRKGATSESRIRIAVGNLGGFRVLWIQPDSGDNAYRTFLREKKDGVFSLNHAVPDREARAREVERMAGLGVGVLQAAELAIGNRTRSSVCLETQSDGRMAVALVDDPKALELQAEPLPVAFEKSQYAFVVKDLAPVSAYWAGLGFPKMEVTHGVLGELSYRGQPGTFDQKLGWQRHGDVTYEWIEPLQGPTVYEDALAVHGEGFHHLAFNVPDMDAAIAFFKGKGYAVSQSGTWGEKGKPGSGRFAYIDTEPIGGVTLELLWNYRE